MKVVVLSGGKGTRLSEETYSKPKPMVEIGGIPILNHIMGIYGYHGFTDFIVALGYKGEMIKDYFLNYYYHIRNFTVDLGNATVDLEDNNRNDWIVYLADTGIDTMTGGRLYRLRDKLNKETFMVTYGDGVSNVDIAELIRFHRSHNKVATMTAVRPLARFGTIKFKGDMVHSFKEKSYVDDSWINGGFFVFEPEILNYITGDATILERDVLEQLSSENQLMAYRHGGFWQCMDTLRDKEYLQEIWDKGNAPWIFNR